MYFSYGILFGCGASLAYTPSLVSLNLSVTTLQKNPIFVLPEKKLRGRPIMGIVYKSFTKHESRNLD
jgi:hypothetical protein